MSAFEGGERVGEGPGWVEVSGRISGWRCLLKGRFSARQQEGLSVHLKSLLTPGNWAPASPWCLPLLAGVGRTGAGPCVLVHLFISHYSKSSVAYQRWIFRDFVSLKKLGTEPQQEDNCNLHVYYH